MVIEKKYLETFFKVLKETELSLSDARIRDRFLKLIQANYQTMTEDRKVILEKFCKKNEDGSPEIIDEKYHFEPEILNEVGQELMVLADETVDIEPENDTTIAKIKSFVEETTYKPLFGESEDIDAIISKIV